VALSGYSAGLDPMSHAMARLQSYEERQMSSHESYSRAVVADSELYERRIREVMRALRVIPRRAPTEEADKAQLREWAERAIAAYEGIK
jgi:Lhr-like helicase